MINVLIPMSGKSIFFEASNYIYPKPLLEVRKKPMIQRVIENLNTLSENINFIFVVNAEDCQNYHLDDVLKLLTGPNTTIIKTERPTAGAACTALLAIEQINNDTPLVISNADQFFENDLSDIIDSFGDADAGLMCFESVHPRWSYALTDQDGHVIQASEKRPISKNAIAGLFYYKHGKSFIKAAMSSIFNGASVNGSFYIAPTLNELVLDNATIKTVNIDESSYYSFYSPQLLEEYNRKSY